MASALHHGEVIALFRSNVAQTWTTAYHINDYAWQLSAREIRNAFLHQAQSRTGRSGHDALARGRSTVNHVDRGYFAFSLQERAADLRDIQRRVFGDLTCRGDGIPIVG